MSHNTFKCLTVGINNSNSIIVYKLVFIISRFVINVVDTEYNVSLQNVIGTQLTIEQQTIYQGPTICVLMVLVLMLSTISLIILLLIYVIISIMFMFIYSYFIIINPFV